MRGATATYNCKCCGLPFTARTADRARGWARFCSKSCKAIKQEARTGQHREFHESRERQERYPTFVGCDLSLDDHDPNKE